MADSRKPRWSLADYIYAEVVREYQSAVTFTKSQENREREDIWVESSLEISLDRAKKHIEPRLYVKGDSTISFESEDGRRDFGRAYCLIDDPFADPIVFSFHPGRDFLDFIKKGEKPKATLGYIN